VRYLGLFKSLCAATICSLVFSLSGLAQAEEKTAIFAGGCFWCVESDFEKLNGVKTVVSGYIGGHVSNPTYKQVSSGNSGHTEAVAITFDNKEISFEQLLAHFWVNVDPLDGNGQFCDRGQQYRSELFYLDEQQRVAAQASLDQLNSQPRFAGQIRTALTQATEFYVAEEYHQDYYKKNPGRYNYYRWRCGRDQRLEELWGKTTK
jgi:methionine-S-sulfoxide reductase